MQTILDGAQWRSTSHQPYWAGETGIQPHSGNFGFSQTIPSRGRGGVSGAWDLQSSSWNLCLGGGHSEKQIKWFKCLVCKKTLVIYSSPRYKNICSQTPWERFLSILLKSSGVVSRVSWETLRATSAQQQAVYGVARHCGCVSPRGRRGGGKRWGSRRGRRGHSRAGTAWDTRREGLCFRKHWLVYTKTTSIVFVRAKKNATNNPPPLWPKGGEGNWLLNQSYFFPTCPSGSGCEVVRLSFGGKALIIYWENKCTGGKTQLMTLGDFTYKSTHLRK